MPAFIAQRIENTADEPRDDRIPISQRVKTPIDVAMFRVSGIDANSHLHAGNLDLVEQFDQRRMSFEKVCFAAKLRRARVLRLAERMP